MTFYATLGSLIEQNIWQYLFMLEDEYDNDVWKHYLLIQWAELQYFYYFVWNSTYRSMKKAC